MKKLFKNKKVVLIAVGALILISILCCVFTPRNNSNNATPTPSWTIAPTWTTIPTSTTVPTAMVNPGILPSPTKLPATSTPILPPTPTLNACSGHSAVCNDGSFSDAKNSQGACSRHSGVKIWCGP